MGTSPNLRNNPATLMIAGGMYYKWDINHIGLKLNSFIFETLSAQIHPKFLLIYLINLRVATIPCESLNRITNTNQVHISYHF